MIVPFLPGVIPDLFSEEEVEGITSGLRAEVRAAGLLDSKENRWRFFTDRVRQQLTVWPFTVSPLEARLFCPCNCNCKILTRQPGIRLNQKHWCEKTHQCELLRQECHSRIPTFENQKHNQLCSELYSQPSLPSPPAHGGPDTHINTWPSQAAELKVQLLPNVNKYVGQAELAEPDGL